MIAELLLICILPPSSKTSTSIPLSMLRLEMAAKAKMIYGLKFWLKLPWIGSEQEAVDPEQDTHGQEAILITYQLGYNLRRSGTEFIQRHELAR